MRKSRLTLTLMLPAVLMLSGLSPSACAALATDPATQIERKVPAKKEKLVIQVSDKDPGKWYLALNNARNVQSALGADQVDIEIVVYGPGVAMLEMDSEVGNNVAQALASGVKIIACKNSMKAAKLTDADMLANIGYEVSGVVEIMRRQQQGYNYIRP